MNRPTYVVLNEHTLGYIYVRQPSSVWILAGSVLRGGGDWKNGSLPYGPRDTLRLATPRDFEEYRVQPPPGLFTNEEAYRQGQRDREQGWPNQLRMWELVSLEAQEAYLEGYANPRVEPG